MFMQLSISMSFANDVAGNCITVEDELISTGEQKYLYLMHTVGHQWHLEMNS